MAFAYSQFFKGAVAQHSFTAKSNEPSAFMTYSIQALFDSPAYWLEATVLVAFFVLVNMFPCIRTAGFRSQTTASGYLPTPIQAFSDALGRETTSKECCQQRFCLACREKEIDCECPAFIKQLVPITKEENPYMDQGGEDGEVEDMGKMPQCDGYDDEVEMDEPDNEMEMRCCRPIPPCCSPSQTVVRTHIRATPKGLVPVREHCRALPIPKPKEDCGCPKYEEPEECCYCPPKPKPKPRRRKCC